MTTGKITSWNWAAFVFGPLWFAYRKMYGFYFLSYTGSILIFLLSFIFFYLLKEIQAFTHLDPTGLMVDFIIKAIFGFVILVGHNVLSAVFGDYLYYRSIVRKNRRQSRVKGTSLLSALFYPFFAVVIFLGLILVFSNIIATFIGFFVGFFSVFAH